MKGMNKSKKLFLLIAGIFLLIVLYIVYDMSSRTTFPGQKKQQPVETEQLQNRE
jgi:uncharacterized metal-binding protein